MQQNELTESYIYEAIAKFAKGEENKQILWDNATLPSSAPYPNSINLKGNQRKDGSKRNKSIISLVGEKFHY